MKNKFNDLWNWFSLKPQKTLGIRSLQIVLGCVFLFRVFTELPFAEYLYGTGGIGDNQLQNSTYINLFGDSFSTVLQGKFFLYFFLFMLATAGSCYIVNYRTRIATFVSLIAFNVLSSLNSSLGDGGDNITQIILIYMLLLIPLNETFKEGGIKVWFHNLGIFAIGAQIMILYFTAGFMKINGNTWVSGTALYDVSQVESFSLPLIREIFKNPYISTISTYTTMIFLVWFPIAMFSKLKYVWIFMGIFFHLGILGFMGLITFALTMIGMEMFFVGDEEYVKLMDFVKDFGKRFQIDKYWKVLNDRLNLKL